MVDKRAVNIKRKRLGQTPVDTEEMWRRHKRPPNCQDTEEKATHKIIYLFGVYVIFNTVRVISRQAVLWAEKTSFYSWPRFCTVNCRPSVSNYQLFPTKSRV